MNLIKKGATSNTRYYKLVDSTTGAPKTAYTITNLDLQYTRNRTAPVAKVDATALAATSSAFSANQAIEIDATSSPGLYRVDWPDAAFATGVDKVILCVSGPNIDPAFEEIQLVDFDPFDAVRLGLTALPNANAEAAGGLYTRGSGAGQINQNANGQVDTRTVAMATDTVNAAALATDAVTEIQTGLATSSALSTMQTDVTTIKGKTNSLTFTVAGQLDANIQSVNDVTVNGVGTPGSPWGP